MGVDHSPDGTQVDVKHPVKAGVQRQVREEHLGARDHAGERGTESAVEEGGHRLGRPGEVIAIRSPLMVIRTLTGTRPSPLAGSKSRKSVGLPGAVRHLGDALTGQTLDIVLDLLHGGHDSVLAVLLDQPQQLISATRVASSWACRSPSAASGARVFETINRTTSPQYRPRWKIRIGGIRRPSPKCSLALTSKSPARCRQYRPSGHWTAKSR